MQSSGLQNRHPPFWHRLDFPFCCAKQHQALGKTGEWIENVQSRPVRRQNNWTYRQYWQCQNDRAAITVK